MYIYECVYVCIYICIHTYKASILQALDSEEERRKRLFQVCMHVCIFVYIFQGERVYVRVINLPQNVIYSTASPLTGLRD